MSTFAAASALPSATPAEPRHGGWRRHRLLPWQIPVMILGFIAWWPVGLGLLALFAWLNATPGAAAWTTPWKNRARDAVAGAFPSAGSGNAAFDEHRAAVLRRLEEERRAVDAQQAEFAAFMQQLRRARDQEEFDRFVNARSQRAG
jgi:hypothetical protein